MNQIPLLEALFCTWRGLYCKIARSHFQIETFWSERQERSRIFFVGKFVFNYKNHKSGALAALLKTSFMTHTDYNLAVNISSNSTCSHVLFCSHAVVSAFAECLTEFFFFFHFPPHLSWHELTLVLDDMLFGKPYPPVFAFLSSSCCAWLR